MKYVFLLAVLLSPIVNADNTVPKNVLPDDWSSHVYGIEVREPDLGRYLGLDQFDGEAFHFYWNEVQDNQGDPLFCFYPVHAEKLYLGMVYCTGLKNGGIDTDD